MVSSILSNMQIMRAKKYSLDVVVDEYQILNKSKKNYNSYIKNEEIIFNKSIKLKNVNFLYNDNVILQNANMEIKRGSFIGLIGESGTGKSTFLNIIAGLLKCSSGKILIDNNEKNIYENNFWYDKISYVSQNVYLSDDSILNNIALGRKDKKIKLDEIMDIIEKVNLLDFVKNLKKGIKTFIGEGGGKLSGGQMQRIGLARAIYKNGDIFIIDEPTNSLDYNNEKKILNLLKTLKGKKTIIMSSHKKSNFHFCDKIFELSNRKIIETKK
jgi:ABC-type bacteriocin/lantibiotic exporter with double-glycine peptidase domain